MSAVTQPPIFMQPPPYPVYKLSVERFQEMIRTGIIDEDARVELLEGWMVPKMVHNPPHDATIELTHDAVKPRLPPGWRIRIQSSITTDDSEPEPDVAVVRGEKSRHFTRHPSLRDIGLLIEVSEASLQRDRDDKGRLYARARIARYWIINLVDRQVEVYTDPTGPDANPRYRQRQDYDVTMSVPLELDDVEVATIPVQELLPPE